MNKVLLSLAIGLASVCSGFAQCAKVDVPPKLLSSGKTICPNSSFRINGSSGYWQTDVTYTLNWGDGSLPVGVSNNNYYTIYHTYTKVGKYITSLTGTNGCGNSNTSYDTVFVVNNLHFPANSIYYNNKKAACPGEEVNFSFYSTGSMKAQLWDFGNGITSTKDYAYHTEAKAGNYPITLKLTNMCGIDTLIKDTLKIVNNLHFSNLVNISNYTKEVCPGASFNLWTNSSRSVKNYLWDFGDGTTSQKNSPDHTYATIGTKTISLKMTNYCGIDTTLTTTVYVKPNLGFGGNASINTAQKACIGDEISFEARTDAEIKSYAWNFGDNSTSTQSEVSHTYNANNLYNVYVKLTNYCGVDTLISTPVTIENAKSFSHGADDDYDFYGPSEICPNEKGKFRFYPNELSIKKAVWDFADGSPNITAYNLKADQGSSVLHSFSAKGNYPVNITLTNGCNVDTNIVIRVYKDKTYIANPYVTVKDSVLIDEVRFELLASDSICLGDNFELLIINNFRYTTKLDFGDGTILNDADKSSIFDGYPIFNHKYNSVGLKKIKISLTNACGISATDSFSVFVNSTVKLNEINKSNIEYYILDSDNENSRYFTNDTINFIVVSSGSSYTWTFGDGVVETTENAANTHIYKNSGVYNTKVFVQSACGDTITLKQTINVDGKVAGIENSLNSSKITVYPNPSNDVINLSLTEVINGTVTLVDIQGNEIVSKSINDKETSIATDNIPSGVYILKVLTDNAIYTKQVILVK